MLRERTEKKRSEVVHRWLETDRKDILVRKSLRKNNSKRQCNECMRTKTRQGCVGEGRGCGECSKEGTQTETEIQVVVVGGIQTQDCMPTTHPPPPSHQTLT